MELPLLSLEAFKFYSFLKIQMPKIYLVKEIIAEILKQYPMTKGELEMTEIELQYKTYKELENILEVLQEENETA